MFDIELKSISKTFLGSDEPALNDINIEVEKGSIVTLLGPSGSGKSTTLRIIAGFERAESGSVAIAGEVVSDEVSWIPPERRGIGMVFQDYALFPHLTVFNNIGFGYKGKDRDERIKEVMKLVNLEGFEKRYPNELSGGQQQRVALARALARRPVVVLLDEPFSNLDADLRIQMRMEVKRIIKEAGATAVFVSHDQKDALSISDKIIVMRDGKVQQTGTPQEIYKNPINRFVATFIGSSTIVKGVISKDGHSVLTEIGNIVFNNINNLNPDEEVYVSIRPESLKVDDDGNIKGIVKQMSYTGESIELVVELLISKDEKQEVLIHIHSDKIINIGDQVKFNIVPKAIAVIRRDL
ncbi:iron(III) transport system ATP-binding protein [Natranaerovirga pectinivora]|uniref:ABC-type quaternary amine transporter n=1 Tax=Natranaerovirga pectinivora TaxID=682400 RepID=A0A4V2V0H5_9FIRM|nr:ABC transporter ATP-binding protein [Natranaerovirga pectinivora]TCT16137.1 iron(III) transport system ATP-binding protein [Natranaerovirga pectinivora]